MFLQTAAKRPNVSNPLLTLTTDFGDASPYVAAMKGYGQVMLADPKAYDGYYQWQVYTKTTAGTFLLPEGYPAQPAVRTSG